MKGTVKTYLPTKKYGFIKGDDSNDYFFHVSAFDNHSDVDNVCEGAVIEFEEAANNKGYYAKRCKLTAEASESRYTMPDKLLTSKGSSISGWDLLEEPQWWMHGNSTVSPDAAKNDLIKAAQSYGVTGLLNLQYYKTTGSRGNYLYSVHNFKAQPVKLAKRHFNGQCVATDFIGINAEMAELKQLAKTKTKNAWFRRLGFWVAALALPVVLAMPLLWLGSAFLLLRYGFRPVNRDWWIEPVKI